MIVHSIIEIIFHILLFKKQKEAGMLCDHIAWLFFQYSAIYNNEQ